MKITIEIPDEEILDAVKMVVVQDLARKAEQELFPKGDDFYYSYYTDIRQMTRELLRKHLDSITNLAVDAAAVSIEKKGLKKLLDKASDS